MSSSLVWAAVVGIATVIVGAIVLRNDEGAPVHAGQRVVLLGDSIGVGIAHPLEQSLADAGVGFSSQAVQGWTVAKVLAAYQASDATADVAVLSVGSNDTALADPAKEADAAKDLVALCLARGARRILWVAPPNFQIDPPPPPATKAKQEVFHDLMDAASPQLEVIVPSADVVRQLGADRIHLPPAGYRLLASEITIALFH